MLLEWILKEVKGLLFRTEVIIFLEKNAYTVKYSLKPCNSYLKSYLFKLKILECFPNMAFSFNKHTSVTCAAYKISKILSFRGC